MILKVVEQKLVHLPRAKTSPSSKGFSSIRDLKINLNLEVSRWTVFTCLQKSSSLKFVKRQHQPLLMEAHKKIRLNWPLSWFIWTRLLGGEAELTKICWNTWSVSLSVVWQIWRWCSHFSAWQFNHIIARYGVWISYGIVINQRIQQILVFIWILFNNF